jgi:hypothetical protein
MCENSRPRYGSRRHITGGKDSFDLIILCRFSLEEIDYPILLVWGRARSKSFEAGEQGMIFGISR